MPLQPLFYTDCLQTSWLFGDHDGGGRDEFLQQANMSDTQTVYRILDASANRAAEGLRTLEEYARFGLDHSSLAEQLKLLRHELTSSLESIAREQLLMARDTESDVGTRLGTPAEYDRADLPRVITAAASRVQQSLRVLEEYGKILDTRAAQQIEQIRYRSYTLGAELEMRASRGDRSQKLQNARLYVLVDAGNSEESFARLVNELARGDVDIIQLRDRQVSDRTLIARARLGTEIAREHQKLFILNDRADLAVAADTDGVHVGQDELPAPIARQIIGPERLLGISTHSIQQAREAEQMGADYIGCGPVFPGRTKQFDAYVGTELLQQVAKETTIPAFAIGGIDPSNLHKVVETGCLRVAVTGAIRDASNPTAAATAIRKILSESDPGHSGSRS